MNTPIHRHATDNKTNAPQTHLAVLHLLKELRGPLRVPAVGAGVQDAVVRDRGGRHALPRHDGEPLVGLAVVAHLWCVVGFGGVRKRRFVGGEKKVLTKAEGLPRSPHDTSDKPPQTSHHAIRIPYILIRSTPPCLGEGPDGGVVGELVGAHPAEAHLLQRRQNLVFVSLCGFVLSFVF